MPCFPVALRHAGGAMLRATRACALHRTASWGSRPQPGAPRHRCCTRYLPPHHKFAAAQQSPSSRARLVAEPACHACVGCGALSATVRTLIRVHPAGDPDASSCRVSDESPRGGTCRAQHCPGRSCRGSAVEGAGADACPARPLTRRSSTCHTPPSDITRPASVGQEHVTRCSALMVQFADRLSAQHLARPPSWGWLAQAVL